MSLKKYILQESKSVQNECENIFNNVTNRFCYHQVLVTLNLKSRDRLLNSRENLLNPGNSHSH
jgi:hypothetical protein